MGDAGDHALIVPQRLVLGLARDVAPRRTAILRRTAEQNERFAWFVDKILRGAKPAELPIQQPTRFSLVVNLKAAKALGIKVPQSILLRADDVVQRSFS